jgi:cleavage and polyadenylation specificity factor subunit 3
MASIVTGGQNPNTTPTTATREGDQLVITPLGAGNEVGRSCVHMTFKGKSVLVIS